MKLTATATTAVLCFASAFASAAQTGAVFADNAKPQNATVSILAQSSAMHNGYSGSQDIYLADVEIKGQHQFVRLMDIYEGFGYPIRHSLIASRTLFKMQVVRQTECDLRGDQLFLPPDSRIYDASVTDTVRTHAADMIPCYRTVHKSIKLAKK